MPAGRARAGARSSSSLRRRYESSRPRCCRWSSSPSCCRWRRRRILPGAARASNRSKVCVMNETALPLSLNGIRRTFEQGDRRLDVLKGITLDLRPGEIVALVGQSGSGKSTLLHIAGLLERPDEGDIVIDGKSAGAAGDRERTVMRRQFLGFVYQYHHLLPEFSAIENVMLPQMLNGRSRTEARRRATELLALVQLKEIGRASCRE